jgi:hypothetical protein
MPEAGDSSELEVVTGVCVEEKPGRPSDRMVLKISKRFLKVLGGLLMPRKTRVLQVVRDNELSDLEGFEMSPGQDIPAAIKTLAVSAPKIERGSARRIGHQNNG